jgi:hypothetical protein
MNDIGKQFEILRRSGWTLYFFGSRNDSHGLGVTRFDERPHPDDPEESYADVILVRAPDDACAFRGIRYSFSNPAEYPTMSLFSPRLIVWHKRGSSIDVVREIRRRSLDEFEPRPPDACCGIPLDWPLPILVSP